MGYRKYCLHCHRIIPRKRNRDKVKKFCNRNCSSKFLFSAPIIKCKNCGEEMSSARSRIFCSCACKDSYRTSTYTKKCPVCKNNFILHNKAYEKRGGGTYCSTTCSGIARKKQNVNEYFFDRIDNEKKAYWLGFLYADGYQSGLEITVNLKSTEIEHLKKLKKDIDSSAPLKIRFDKNPKLKNGGSEKVTLRIYSPKLCKSLKAKGCIKAKSLIVEYPTFIRKKLERHFIRGYFDGDGCVSIHKARNKRKEYLSVTFYSGSVKFIDGLQKSLNKNGLIFNRGKKNTRFLYARKKDLIISIYSFLYKRSKIYLERKKDRFVRNFKKYGWV